MNRYWKLTLRDNETNEVILITYIPKDNYPEVEELDNSGSDYFTEEFEQQALQDLYSEEDLWEINGTFTYEVETVYAQVINID
jgi:hypothetical protein